MTCLKKLVLVIDDEPQITKLLEQRLENSHFRCITASDAVIGLKKASEEKPDLILLDLMLPKMSGLGFLRILKSNPNLSWIPVVVLTALDDPEVAREARDLGALGYVVKTDPPQKVIRMIQDYAR